MRIGLFAWLILLAALTAPARGTESYDLVIRHGRVVDGSGNPAFFADVAVRQGRIAALGHIERPGRIEINAAGLIVAPGFIDVHTHADEVAAQPLAENFVRMGVTTVVAGNCGSSTLDVARFFRGIERTNAAVNVATLIGHNSVRRKAMGGSFARPPTSSELAQMKALVGQAMKDGAAGLSTGLIYQPGVHAQTDEIVALAKVIAPYGGIYASHMRHEGAQIYQALDEVFQVARAAGIRAEVSHLKLSGPNAWGQAGQVLARLEQARAEGLDITQDQYVYTASSTGLSQLLPAWALEGGRDEFRQRVADPALKARLIADLKRRLRDQKRDDFSYAVIASCAHDRALEGLNLAQAAQAKRGSAALEDQIETLLEIQARGGASGVFHNMNEDDLQVFLRHPNTMVACDSGLRKFGEGMPHPRGYGNNARVLARYVRELKVLRLEDAIRKMTSLPANTFRLSDRGLLRPGAWADLVVFDADKVQDRATFPAPHQYPDGIPHVIVNGIPVIQNGQHTGAKAGKALRHSR